MDLLTKNHLIDLHLVLAISKLHVLSKHIVRLK